MSRAADEKLDRWVKKEAKKIEVCAGGTARIVREWIRKVQQALPRVPPNMGVDIYMRELISQTCQDELFDENEAFLNNANNRAAITYPHLLDHLLESFLGPDEVDVLKDEVKKVKQGQREEIPAYNRRFRKTADVAFPNPTPEEQARLTQKYLGNMHAGRIKDKLVAEIGDC